MFVKSFSSGSVCILAFIALVVAAAAPTSAAEIAFRQGPYSDGAISTTGTLIGALNPAIPDAVIDETVNGVLFTAITHETANAGPVALSGGVIASIYNQATTAHLGNGPEPHGHPLTDVFFFTSGEGTGALEFFGLTEGQQYELQLIMGDNRDVLDVEIWSDQTDNSGDSDIFVDHAPDPKMVTGVFTADATGTQSLYVEVIPNFPGHFNAMQLRAIPEPSSLVVCGLGLLCLGVSGRRRKK